MNVLSGSDNLISSLRTFTVRKEERSSAIGEIYPPFGKFHHFSTLEYGGFSLFFPNGRVYFASYRDPNLKKTLENYDASSKYLREFKADETDMTRFIIGTIARMDRPLTPSQKGNLAVQRYIEKTTLNQVEKDRAAVLATKAEDINKMEKMVADILAQNAYCVYGNEDKIESEKELFNKLIPLNE